MANIWQIRCFKAIACHRAFKRQNRAYVLRCVFNYVCVHKNYVFKLSGKERTHKNLNTHNLAWGQNLIGSRAQQLTLCAATVPAHGWMVWGKRYVFF